MDADTETIMNLSPASDGGRLSAAPFPRRCRQEITAVVMFWISLFLMVGVPLWLLFQALGDAQRQHRIVSTYQPVQAKVWSSAVTKWEDSEDADHSDADIRYEYEVNGKTYQSGQLAPLPASGSEGWAEAMVSRYKPGQSCDAFNDPAHPDRAVLLRRYSFLPYQELLECAFILTSGCFMVTYLWFAKRPKLTPADNGWFVITPESGERQRLLRAKVCTVAWYLFGTIPAAHYFLCVPPPHSDRAIAAFEIFYALGLIPVAFLVRYWWMNRNMEEARFLVDQPQGTLGRRLRFSVSQMARRQLQLKQASVRLRCVGTKRRGHSSSSTILFEATPAVRQVCALHMGEDLTLSGEVTLPSDQAPSGRDGTGKFDGIAWKLLLNCELLHAPDYSTEYRLEVKAPPIETPEPAAKPAASVDVRAIEPEFAGRILSKGNWIKGLLLTLLPNAVLLVGAGLVVSVFLTIFPDKNGTAAFWDLPKPQAQRVFGVGAALVVMGSVWGLGFSGRLGNGYIRAVARREIKRRPDAIVRPDANSQFVEIIPRENWNRAMFKNQKDTGFLTVDAARREIRFEGDRERYRIPADALLSCDVEKSVFTSSAKPTAPGYFLVVLRAQTPSGIWEAPVSPLASSSIFNSKSRQRAAEILQAKIKTLHPAMMIREDPRRIEASTQMEV